MKTYYTYNEATKQLTPAKRILVLENKTMILGNAADFAKYLGAYPQGESAPPACDEGYHAVADGYDLKDGKWVRKWHIEPIVYTVNDYDSAMEEYLRHVRAKRGYTTREPDTYLHSSNPRWSQDAKDWISFKDEVMTYALEIINFYSDTGNAPSLAEFKAGFPKIVWSYKEEA